MWCPITSYLPITFSDGKRKKKKREFPCYTILESVKGGWREEVRKGWIGHFELNVQKMFRTGVGGFENQWKWDSTVSKIINKVSFTY